MQLEDECEKIEIVIMD